MRAAPSGAVLLFRVAFSSRWLLLGGVTLAAVCVGRKPATLATTLEETNVLESAGDGSADRPARLEG
jgi:hypothetical protein